jgi:glycosyltransferase involved in cell wall biosynthesis
MSVTVVVPTKDRPDLLRLTVASVLAQQDVEARLVVVDDGGSDDSAEALARLGPRVTVLRHERSRGVASARNAGLKAVETEWVAFLDDDDLWGPAKLRNQLQALARDRSCRWACSTAVFFRDRHTALTVHRAPAERDISRAILRENVIPAGGSGVLAQTQTVLDLGGFDARYATLADWDLWIRLSQISPVAAVPLADVAYRVQHASMSHGPRTMDELESLVEKHAALYDSHDVRLDSESLLNWLRVVAYRAGDWHSVGRHSIELLRGYGLKSGVLVPVQQQIGQILRVKGVRRGSDGVALRYASDWLSKLIHSAGAE